MHIDPVAVKTRQSRCVSCRTSYRGVKDTRRSEAGHGERTDTVAAVSTFSMTFTVQNVYYLRISATTILTTVLYLDQRHVAWMNENSSILEHVVHDIIRPQLVHLLQDVALHATDKMQTAEQDVFRVLYYFQDVERSPAVLLKVCHDR